MVPPAWPPKLPPTIDPATATPAAVQGLANMAAAVPAAEPHLSVLFFASYISLEEALDVWDTGRRTPIESFAALRTPGSPTNREE